MGSRGPAPAPAAMKIRAGETRPSRVNYREPRPRKDPPRLPPGMDREARRVWRAVLATMPPGVIVAADGPILRVFVEAYSRYTSAARLLAESGPLVRSSRDGALVKNPLNQVVRETAELVRLVGRELGLSPSARAGLRIEVNSFSFNDIEADLGPARPHLVENLNA